MSQIDINADTSPLLLNELIYEIKVKDAMSRELVLASRDTPMREIQALMKRWGISGVPIADGSRLLGLVSIDDIINALERGSMNDPASAHMTSQLVVLEDDMPISFAISYFGKYTFGRFPVLNKNRELVGIISSRDVSASLLVELSREVNRLEHERGGASSPDVQDAYLMRQFNIEKLNFEQAGKASNQIRKLLKSRDVSARDTRRVAVASYELEMNQVVHSVGGTMTFWVRRDRVEITAQDRGPGIDDLKCAMEEGFSTANEWVRSLGFGAGMGLPNSKRVSDEFDISSSPEGTVVRVVVRLADEMEDEKHDD